MMNSTHSTTASSSITAAHSTTDNNSSSSSAPGSTGKNVLSPSPFLAPSTVWSWARSTPTPSSSSSTKDNSGMIELDAEQAKQRYGWDDSIGVALVGDMLRSSHPTSAVPSLTSSSASSPQQQAPSLQYSIDNNNNEQYYVNSPLEGVAAAIASGPKALSTLRKALSHLAYHPDLIVARNASSSPPSTSGNTGVGRPNSNNSNNSSSANNNGDASISGSPISSSSSSASGPLSSTSSEQLNYNNAKLNAIVSFSSFAYPSAEIEQFLVPFNNEDLRVLAAASASSSSSSEPTLANYRSGNTATTNNYHHHHHNQDMMMMRATIPSSAIIGVVGGDQQCNLVIPIPTSAVGVAGAAPSSPTSISSTTGTDNSNAFSLNSTLHASSSFTQGFSYISGSNNNNYTDNNNNNNNITKKKWSPRKVMVSAQTQPDLARAVAALTNPSADGISFVSRRIADSRAASAAMQLQSHQHQHHSQTGRESGSPTGFSSRIPSNASPPPSFTKATPSSSSPVSSRSRSPTSHFNASSYSAVPITLPSYLNCTGASPAAIAAIQRRPAVPVRRLVVVVVPPIVVDQPTMQEQSSTQLTDVDPVSGLSPTVETPFLGAAFVGEDELSSSTNQCNNDEALVEDDYREGPEEEAETVHADGAHTATPHEQGTRQEVIPADTPNIIKDPTDSRYSETIFNGADHVSHIYSTEEGNALSLLAGLVRELREEDEAKTGEQKKNQVEEETSYAIREALADLMKYQQQMDESVNLKPSSTSSSVIPTFSRLGVVLPKQSNGYTRLQHPSSPSPASKISKARFSTTAVSPGVSNYGASAVAAADNDDAKMTNRRTIVDSVSDMLASTFASSILHTGNAIMNTPLNDAGSQYHSVYNQKQLPSAVVKDDATTRPPTPPLLPGMYPITNTLNVLGREAFQLSPKKETASLQSISLSAKPLLKSVVAPLYTEHGANTRSIIASASSAAIALVAAEDAAKVWGSSPPHLSSSSSSLSSSSTIANEQPMQLSALFPSARSGAVFLLDPPVLNPASSPSFMSGVVQINEGGGGKEEEEDEKLPVSAPSPPATSRLIPSDKKQATLQLQQQSIAGGTVVPIDSFMVYVRTPAVSSSSNHQEDTSPFMQVLDAIGAPRGGGGGGRSTGAVGVSPRVPVMTQLLARIALS